MPPTDAEILTAARALLDTPDRWWRGTLYDHPANCHCPVTAIDAVVRQHNLAAHGYVIFRIDTIFADIVAPRLGTPVSRIVSWHDDPARTHSDVLAAFDRAIAAASV